jgi:hypothetical protein
MWQDPCRATWLVLLLAWNYVCIWYRVLFCHNRDFRLLLRRKTFPMSTGQRMLHYDDLTTEAQLVQGEDAKE